MYSKIHSSVCWLNIMQNKRCEGICKVSRPNNCWLVTCRHCWRVGCSVHCYHSRINVARAFPVAKCYLDESKMGRPIVTPNQRNVAAYENLSGFIRCRNKSLTIPCWIMRSTGTWKDPCIVIPRFFFFFTISQNPQLGFNGNVKFTSPEVKEMLQLQAQYLSLWVDVWLRLTLF